MSRPASAQARADSLTRRRIRRFSWSVSIHARSRGHAVSSASCVIWAVSASIVIRRASTNLLEQVSGVLAVLAVPAGRSARPAAGLRRVVRDVHQAEEEPSRHFLLTIGEAGIDLLGSPGDGSLRCRRLPDSQPPSACRRGCAPRWPGARATAVAAPPPRGRARLAAGRVRGASSRSSTSTRPSSTSSRASRAGSAIAQRTCACDIGPSTTWRSCSAAASSRVAQRAIVEISAQSEHNHSRAGQRAERADEHLPLVLVAAVGEDLLELVHHDERPAGHAPAWHQPGGARRVTAQCRLDVAGGLRCARPGVAVSPSWRPAASRLNCLANSAPGDSRLRR